MSKQAPVGIDLGTTYSAMAWMDESGHSALIPNAEGELLTPSVVLFEDDRVLVGKEAKRLGAFEADRMVECAKREMGSPLFSRAICGRKLPPEVIQAFVLKKMRNDLTAVVGDDPRVVITVPAFFDEPRRKATVDAAQMAGLHVLDIVNEPTAAALAFGEELGFLRAGSNQERMQVLVYDLGGGTFDATLIEMQAGNLRTIATDGDYRLGGRDWDNALADFAATEFMREHGRDPREDHVSFVRLMISAEETKHTLTVRNNAVLKVTHAGQTLDVKITRELFEEETAHLLERTAYVARQLLTAAGLQWSDLHRILLVGGSTRMPMVETMLAERTGVQPDHSVNPDEAVARGAAVFADYLLSTHEDSRRKPSFVVTNVNSHSLGIEGVDQQTGRKRNNIIIPRNTPLPAKKTEKFVTRTENQRSVVVKVLEGESSEPSECSPIGRTVIRDLPQGLKGNWPIHVTYEYGTNGRLNVRAKVHGTDRETILDLEREGALSNAMVTQWGRLIGSGCGLSRFEEMLSGKPAPAAAAAPSAQPKAKAEAKPKQAAPAETSKAVETPKPIESPKPPAPARSQPAAATAKPSSQAIPQPVMVKETLEPEHAGVPAVQAIASQPTPRPASRATPPDMAQPAGQAPSTQATGAVSRKTLILLLLGAGFAGMGLLGIAILVFYFFLR